MECHIFPAASSSSRVARLSVTRPSTEAVTDTTSRGRTDPAAQLSGGVSNVDLQFSHPDCALIAFTLASTSDNTFVEQVTPGSAQLKMTDRSRGREDVLDAARPLPP